MSTDTLSPPRTATAGPKIASGAAVFFAVSLFASVASVNVPGDATDADLLAWWHDAGNQTSVIVSMFCGIAAAIFFAVVANHLRALVSGSDHVARFAQSMAAAYTAALLVTAAVRGAVGYQVKVAGEPVPDVGVLRYSTSLGYALLDNVAMTTLALSILAFSVAVIRTGALGRWVAIVGIVCAVVIAGAVAASVGAFAIPLALLWAVCAAVAIWRRAAG